MINTNIVFKMQCAISLKKKNQNYAKKNGRACFAPDKMPGFAMTNHDFTDKGMQSMNYKYLSYCSYNKIRLRQLRTWSVNSQRALNGLLGLFD